MKKTKRNTILFKLGIMMFTVYAIYSLISLQFQVQAKKTELATIQGQIEQQEIRNAEIQATIENKDDPEYLAKIARDKLGYITPGEKVFINITN